MKTRLSNHFIAEILLDATHIECTMYHDTNYTHLCLYTHRSTYWSRTHLPLSWPPVDWTTMWRSGPRPRKRPRPCRISGRYSGASKLTFSWRRTEKTAQCRCWTGTLKNLMKCLCSWEPDHRSTFFFRPPVLPCAIKSCEILFSELGRMSRELMS